MTRTIVVLLLLLSHSFLSAQHLSRQGMLGVAPQALTEEQAKAFGLDSPAGALISQIFPGYSVANMGLQEGDVILQVNGQHIGQPQDLYRISQQLKAGDELSIQYVRDGNTQTATGTASPRPQETSDHAHVRYEEVAFEGGYLRSIVHQPSTPGKHPAIYFIQGFPCQTMEAVNPKHPVKQLLEGFAKAGYVVYRVEKPSQGDSEGTPDCAEIDIATEIAAFRAGMEALLKYDFVDTDNVFVFGHSLGAFEAPYIAEGFKVKGIIGYGFLVDRWHDYNLGLITKQFPIIGAMSYSEAQDFADQARPVLYDFYFNKLSPAELDEKYGNGSEILSQAIDYDGNGYIYGRSYTFWQSLNDLNLVKAYSELKVPVLAMYGEADIEALDKSSVEHLAYLLNEQQAGLGTFRFISGTDHAFIKVGSRKDGWLLKQSGGYGQHMAQNFNPEVVETTVEWMETQMNP